MSSYVVGDLHGQVRILELLLKSVRFDPGKDRLYSVGDVIDRGTDTGELLEFLREGALDGWFVPIMGNHEELLLAYLKDPATHEKSYFDPGFGGRSTISALERSSRANDLVAWMTGWPIVSSLDSVILVHGALPRIRQSIWGDPDLCNVRVDRETGFHSCLLARPPELYPSYNQKTVISGHNIVQEGQFHYKEGIILIDTGAYRTGRLTLYRLEDRSFHTVQQKPRCL
ncbi:MAG: metallophosphoesterase [Leptospirales bacterium]